MAGSWELVQGSSGPEGFKVTGNLKVPRVDLEYSYVITAALAAGSEI
jgi:hypothetical protein